MAVTHGLQIVVSCLLLSASSAVGEPVLYNTIPGCRSNVRLSPGNIIDIRASVERGAELLTGGYETSLVSCIASCCNLARCDLVLYKNVGVSQSGKNCYFVQCGSSDNCVMVRHEGFTSVVISTPTRTSWTAVTENPGSNIATVDNGVTTSPPSQLPSSSESQGTTAPTSPTISLATSIETTTPPTTTATTTPPTTKTITTATTTMTATTAASTTAAAVSHTTNPGAVTSISNTATSIARGSTISPSIHHGGEDGTTSGPEGNSENEGGGSRGEVNVTDLHKAEKPSQLGYTADANPGSIIRAEDDCSQDGCDGGGVIAVAVVGSICFLIIVVVVAVVLKRIASDKRKKRFRNVDYLINGMYT